MKELQHTTFFFKDEVKLVELVSGMRMFLRADRLSLAIEKSKLIPTRLLCTLMDMFFTQGVMAGSTVKSSSRIGLDALDPQTMEALYRGYCSYYFLFKYYGNDE